MTSYEIRHHYFTPLAKEDEVDLKDLLKNAGKPEEVYMARGMTRAEALAKYAEDQKAVAAKQAATRARKKSRTAADKPRKGRPKARSS